MRSTETNKALNNEAVQRVNNNKCPIAAIAER